MKNQTIRDRYAALTVLSQRVLPSKSAINKVSTLITTRFQKPYESTELSRKKIIEELPLPDGFDGDESDIPLAINEKRTFAVDKLMQEEQPIRKIPEALRLTIDDLPRVLKREDGEDNAAGLAQIRVMLGSLYIKGKDEHIADTEQGEEPDELPVVSDAPATAADDFAPEHAE